MSLDGDQVRYLAIEMLTEETDRDRQVAVGASNLSNPCDYCLAAMLSGHDRGIGFMDRNWLGRVEGTAIHGLAAERLAQIYPTARVEQHIHLGRIGQNDIGSTPDFVLVDDGHLIDWKGSTRHKSAIMRDALGQTFFGCKHKDVKISQNAYDKEILAAQFKLQSYLGQTHLYGRGLRTEGIDIDGISLVFINRDGTGFYDNPSLNGYNDITKTRDVWEWTFLYNEDYAEEVWDRGVRIQARLDDGALPMDFQRHPQCIACENDPIAREERHALAA